MPDPLRPIPAPHPLCFDNGTSKTTRRPAESRARRPGSQGTGWIAPLTPGVGVVSLLAAVLISHVGAAAEPSIRTLEERYLTAPTEDETSSGQPNRDALPPHEPDVDSIHWMGDNPSEGHGATADFRSVSGLSSVVLQVDDAVRRVQLQESVQAEPATAARVPFGATTQAFVSAFDQLDSPRFDVSWLNTILTGIQWLQGPTTDAPTLMDNVQGTAQGTRTPARTSGVHATNQRGMRLGQVPARGSYWFPARQDLDTALSKIDSDLVSGIITVKGPYSALYGPGLAFFDVRLLGSPRYPGGYEGHGSTSLDYQTNGEQWNGRQRFWGGSADWGYRIGYGHRTGSDYRTGGGFDLISSYNSRNPYVAVGKDFAEDSHLEFTYLRLDQTDVEFPGQMYDINYLVTDAYEVTYSQENQPYFDLVTLETWYNRTRFEGDDLSPGKREQIPYLDMVLPPPFFGRLLSVTDVDAMSTGFRLAFSWGDTDDGRLTTGVDLRYLKQRLNEFSRIDTVIAPAPAPIFTTGVNNPIPRSHSSNPGLFLETSLPVSDRLDVKAGGRVDWVSTNADQMVPGAVDFFGNPQNLEQVLGGEFDQHFNLWSAFLTSEYQVNDCWTATIGGGHAMRPPTMTELYAVNPYLAVLPQIVTTSAIGDPNLRPEDLWQIDVGLRADYCCVRGGVNGFYSWVDDYITYDRLSYPGTTSSTYAFVNTDWATLSGGEVYGELNWTPWMTSVAAMSYVEGRDHTRDNTVSTARARAFPGTPRSGVTTPEEPLAVIPPWESRVGLRFHPPDENPLWTVAFSARIADNQDRVATSLGEQTTPGFATYAVHAYWQPFRDLLLTAGVENLGDRFYQTFYDTRVRALVYQPGVNFYFGSRLSY